MVPRIVQVATKHGPLPPPSGKEGDGLRRPRGLFPSHEDKFTWVSLEAHSDAGAPRPTARPPTGNPRASTPGAPCFQAKPPVPAGEVQWGSCCVCPFHLPISLAAQSRLYVSGIRVRGVFPDHPSPAPACPLNGVGPS